ncbi:hemerythrin [Clostridium polyendosporum]|uniref:Hemerythrin n=1 Tax=Clostridium polyendosporum TaxID=69208 RepID=A0A919VKA5_9CLOT|nr:hemerythrin domain-containing protein [Clostridium polyendosporum]GIM27438.1 hemerythrin [Clostridium polyendosporum]
MNAIDLMIEEHKNIKRMLQVIRKYSYKVLKGEEIDYNDFFKIIDFVRNYADKHHHGKEESMLFNKMQDELNQAIKKTIQYGMLVEHDLGRFYTTSLEKSINEVKSGNDEARLDVIANAISYAELLNRHIDKEDKILYKFARENLSRESLEQLEKQCREFEEEAEKVGIQQKYMNLLEELDRKIK